MVILGGAFLDADMGRGETERGARRGQRGQLEGFIPRPQHEDDAAEAEERRGPAPPAHPFAEKDDGQHDQAQGPGESDHRRVGQRHVDYGEHHEEDGHGAEQAAADMVGQVLGVKGRVSPPENERQNHQAAEQRPEESDLYGVEFSAQLLGERLEDDKGEARGHHPEGAAEISRQRTPVTVEKGLDRLFDGHERAAL